MINLWIILTAFCLLQSSGDQVPDVDACLSSPCRHNGTCISEGRNFTCLCEDGWTGLDCLNDIDECNISPPCENNGVCLNFDGGYSCTCEEGWSGKNCSEGAVTTLPMSEMMTAFSAIHPTDDGFVTSEEMTATGLYSELERVDGGTLVQTVCCHLL